MRDYEVMTVFQTKEDVFAKGKEIVREELVKAGATITKEEDMGERELAYPVKKQTRGHYILFEAAIDPEKITEIDKSLKLHGEVMKFLFVRKEV